MPKDDKTEEITQAKINIGKRSHSKVKESSIGESTLMIK